MRLFDYRFATFLQSMEAAIVSIPTARTLPSLFMMLWLSNPMPSFGANTSSSSADLGTKHSSRNLASTQSQSSFLELKNQADALLKSGQEKATDKLFQAAIKDLEQAQHLYERLSKNTADPIRKLQIIVGGTINTKLSLTGVYQNIGNTSDSIEYCKQLLELTHTPLPLPNNSQQSDVINRVIPFFSNVTLIALDTLALNYQILRDYPTAIKVLNQRLIESANINNSEEQAKTLMDIASNYGQLGDYQETISYLNRASAFIEKSDKPVEKVKYLGLLSSAHFNIGDYKVAEKYSNQLLANIDAAMTGASVTKRHYLDSKKLEALSMLGNSNLA